MINVQKMQGVLFGLLMILWGTGGSGEVIAEEISSVAPDDSTELLVTRASLRAALLYESPDFSAIPYSGSPVRSKKRSVGAAFGLSALVPGLGQAYNKQWVKAGAAFVMEAAIITSSILWRNEGNGLEQDYQLFAHASWDPAKYAAWLNDYSTFINVTVNPIDVPTSIDFQNPQGWTDQEWQVVLSFFDQIQDVERQMYHVETGAAFSHTLPDFSEQQYYELIGKYYQFAPGWSDYPVWVDENGNLTAAIDPSMTGSDGESRPNVSPTFFRYADDHAHANDVLRRASRVSGLLILTHMVSAIDAAISAKMHNDRITPSLEIGSNAQGDIQPVAKLTIKL